MPITDANGDTIAPLGGWRILSDSTARKTINLTAAPRAVRKISIEDTVGDAASNNITINANGDELIDGNASLTISTNYQRVVLESTGNGWTVIDTAVAGMNTNDSLDVICDSFEMRNAFSLPTTDGTAGQVLTTDGNGNLSWQNDASGSGGDGAVQLVEDLNVITGATGDTTHDCTNSHVFYHSSIAANFCADFTELTISNNETTKATLILDQGTTGYIPSSVKVNGTGSTIHWEGEAQPTPASSSVDKVEMRIMRMSDTYTTVAEYTRHEHEATYSSGSGGGGGGGVDAGLSVMSYTNTTNMTAWDMDGDGTNDSLKPSTSSDVWIGAATGDSFTLSSGYNLEVIAAPRPGPGAANGNWTHAYITFYVGSTLKAGVLFKTANYKVHMSSDGNSSGASSRAFVSPFASDKGSGDTAHWGWTNGALTAPDADDADNNFKMVWEDQNDGTHAFKLYQKGDEGSYWEVNSSGTSTITTGDEVEVRLGFHSSAQLNNIKAGLVSS
jgi:hypothetical protein